MRCNQRIVVLGLLQWKMCLRYVFESYLGLTTQVCDQPHPKKIKVVIEKVREGKMKEAQDIIIALWSSGYAASDIIQTLFRVTKSFDMPEPQKLEFVREIGFSHLRITEGLNTQLQLLGCIARLCNLSSPKIN